MSKTSVGEVYAKVIKGVCEQSQVDFEEGGVDQATLDLLKSEWQKKLSQLKVTHLPWDPPPPAPAAAAPTAPVDRKPPPQSVPSNGNLISAPPPPNSYAQHPRIKQEPGVHPSQSLSSNGYNMPLPTYPQGGPDIARQRAAVHLAQSQYASQAVPQINQLKQGAQPRMPQPGQGGPPMLPHIKPDPDQKPFMPGPQQYPPMPQPNRAPLQSSQTDGNGISHAEWRQEMERRWQMAAENRSSGDRLFHEHFLESQQRREGGGLLLPEAARYAPNPTQKRKVRELEETLSGTGQRGEALPSTAARVTPSSLARAQGDATADDDDSQEVDEDAINSDLDDPDEPGGEENNEENTDQVMLCTYDKVQRVKNKWKCTLKDGILRVDGTEYVFHKGQGEFEW